jgi:hypothetical protein
MKSPATLLAALLAVLGLGDLIIVPVMIQAYSQPPMAAIIASGVLGAATLASIPGLVHGRRWAFWTALACRIVDAVSAVLGTAGGSETVLKVAAAVTLVLSVAAVIMLVRFSRHRAVSVTSAAWKSRNPAADDPRPRLARPARPRLPDADPGCRFEPQLVGGTDIKRAVELVEVPHDLVATEFAGGVRVDGEQADGFLVPDLLPPGASP